MSQQSTLPAKLSSLPSELVIALPSLAGIRVKGEEAKSFLHSQLTIDVNKLPLNTVRRAAHCDFKGKSWSVSLVAQGTEACYMFAPQESLLASVEQLKKYGVFAKMTIESLADTFDYYLLKGDVTQTLLARYFPSLPDEQLSLSESEAGLCMALDFPADTYLVALQKSHSATLLDDVANAEIALLEETVATAMEIANGIPALQNEQHVNQFVPQMMNLQALDAIDFNKGCYMGQEVVARTRYLGKNKRAAMVFNLPQSVTDIENATLEKKAGEHWRSGGTILRYAVLGEETWLLAIVNNDTTADDVFRLSTNPTSELIHGDLPYTL